MLSERDDEKKEEAKKRKRELDIEKKVKGNLLLAAVADEFATACGADGGRLAIADVKVSKANEGATAIAEVAETRAADVAEEIEAADVAEVAEPIADVEAADVYKIRRLRTKHSPADAIQIARNHQLTIAPAYGAIVAVTSERAAAGAASLGSGCPPAATSEVAARLPITGPHAVGMHRHNSPRFAHESTRKQFMCRSGRKGVGSSYRIPYGPGIMTMEQALALARQWLLIELQKAK